MKLWSKRVNNMSLWHYKIQLQRIEIPGMSLTFLHWNYMLSVPCKIPELKCPINSFPCLRPTTMPVISLSQHYTATMSIAILCCHTVQLYGKSCFVHYFPEVQCTWLRFPNDFTVTVFWLICHCPLPDDTIHIWSAAHKISFQVSIPHCFHNISQLHDKSQFWYLSQQFEYILMTHIITPRQTQFS